MGFLSAGPIDPGVLLSAVRRDGDGGLALFVGVVRNEDGGRKVTSLVYEAYAEMAERELARIDAEIRDRHPEARVLFTHRVGTLGVGEVAVVVAAAAPHRAEAFAACREGIEAIKARAPIWKQEIGPGGVVWVDPCGDPCGVHPG
jgi:molybdopterin synthase catalytic subunit